MHSHNNTGLVRKDRKVNTEMVKTMGDREYHKLPQILLLGWKD